MDIISCLLWAKSLLFYSFLALIAWIVWVWINKPTYVQVKRGKHDQITRDNFKAHKVPENLDAIIIGSGIGGLTQAGLMAKAGKRVLLLEQHYIAGGCTHVFDDGGYEFDTGLHYVGDTRSFGTVLNLISDKPIEWARMGTEEDGWVYDEIVVNECKDDSKNADKIDHRYRPGKQAFIDDLEKKFPGEGGKVAKVWMDKCQSAIFHTAFYLAYKVIPSFLVPIIGPLLLRGIHYWGGRSVQDVLDEVTDNKELQAILAGEFGDIGLPPKELPFYMIALIVDHYNRQGGFYPVGGPEQIARGIIPVIERNGGRCLVRAKVDEILIDTKTHTAYGVRLANREQTEITAPLIISAAGFTNTFNRLISEQVANELKFDHHDTISLLKPSTGHLYGFFGFKGDTKEFGLRSSNIWHLGQAANYKFDLTKLCHDYYADPMGKCRKNMLCFIGSPSAKDPSWSARYPNKTTVVVISEGQQEWFQDYLYDKQGSRSTDYRNQKEEIAQAMLRCVYHHYPQLEGKLEYKSIGTPLTNNYFLNAPHGESYGLAHSLARFTNDELIRLLRPSTCINGLVLSGQDVAFCGIGGALCGGALSAYHCLGVLGMLKALIRRG